MQNALNSPQFRRRAALWLGFALLAVAALLLAARIPRTLTVFLIAAFIAFGVYPLVIRLERRMPRSAAVAVVYAGLAAAIVILLILVVPATIAQIQALAVAAPEHIATVQTAINNTESTLRVHFGNAYLPPGYNDLQSYMTSKAAAMFSTLLASLSGVLIGTLTAAVITLSALVLSAFFVFRGEHVADSLYDALPVRRRPQARALGAEVARVFGGYVAGQSVLCALVGALTYVSTAVLGFKFALLLGIISGLAYAVPLFGSIAAHVAATLLAAPQGGQMILWVNVFVFVLFRVADNVLVPKIMSDSVGVSPIVVMFAVFAGGELFGLPGLLLGIPAAALTKVAWKFFRTPAAAAVEPESLTTVPSTVVPIPQEA